MVFASPKPRNDGKIIPIKITANPSTTVISISEKALDEFRQHSLKTPGAFFFSQ
jgi:hypothetical protein